MYIGSIDNLAYCIQPVADDVLGDEYLFLIDKDGLFKFIPKDENSDREAIILTPREIFLGILDNTIPFDIREYILKDE